MIIEQAKRIWQIGLSTMMTIAIVASFVFAATSNGPQPALGLYWLQNSDPTVSPGVNAPLNQLLFRTDTPSIYYKSGSANTAWTRLGNGAAPTPPTVTSVVGTYPVTVTNDAGVFRVGVDVEPDGGLVVVDDGGLALAPNVSLGDASISNLNVLNGLKFQGHLVMSEQGGASTFDIQAIKLNDVLVMGPSAGLPILYSTDANGTLSVVQTITAGTVGSMAVPLTTIGVTDWVVPPTTAGVENRKINIGVGSPILAPIPVAANCGGFAVAIATCASCPFNVTWTASDSTGQTGSPGTGAPPNSRVDCNSGTGQGFVYRAIAKTTSQVFRLYLSQGLSGSITQVCTGTLSDGSAGPVSTTGVVTSGANSWFRQEWTFASKINGAILSVYCRQTVSPGATNSIVWNAMALSPT